MDKQPDGDTRLVIETGMPATAMIDGASIACQGVCLTVVEQGDDWFAVQASQETLDKTTLGQWKIGNRINLEPSLKMGDELGGHLVFGHVDTTAKISVIEPVEDSHRLRFTLPDHLAPMIAPKGSITIDGISLTVNEVTGHDFGVNIIPYTWNHTTLGHRAIGDKVNIEIDMLARYAARALEFVE